MLLDKHRCYSSWVERPGRENDHSCLVIRLRKSATKHLHYHDADRNSFTFTLTEIRKEGPCYKLSMENGKCSLTWALALSMPVSQPYCVCWHASSYFLIR
jgi:hypothetical protein